MLRRSIARGVTNLETTDGATSRVGPLRDRQHQLLQEIGALTTRLENVSRDSRSRADFAGELAEQSNRLAAVGVADVVGVVDQACPLCGTHLNERHASVEAIRSHLADITGRLASVRSIEPIADSAKEDLERRIGELQSELRGIDREIRAATEASAQLTLNADRQNQQAYVSGRIAEFLSALPPSDDAVGRLAARVAALNEEVHQLTDDLDPATARVRAESMLRMISQDLTVWANRLKLGYSESSVQLSLDALSVVADTAEGPVPLERMGSAATIIGYHVAAHLALHKWFINAGRPVPSFLMLDQPSQAFFPDDVIRDEDERMTDDDRERITALYDLIRGVIAELNGALQVIIVDHANLDLEWFQASVVENWRRGNALVPSDWINLPSPESAEQSS